VTSYLSEQLPKWLIWPIVIFFTLFLICIVIGIIFYDAPQFLGNLLAGLAGVFFSFAIALLFVNSLVDHYRKQEWRRVRTLIISALTLHIGNIASEYMVHLYGPGLNLLNFSEDIAIGYREAHPQTKAALQSIVKMLEETHPVEAQEQAVQLHSVIEWDLTQIRTTLLPRVLIIAYDESEFANLLTELDNSDREWVNEIHVQNTVAAGNPYKAAINTLKAATRVYEYLISYS
jgi:hypothetical protein